MPRWNEPPSDPDRPSAQEVDEPTLTVIRRAINTVPVGVVITDPSQEDNPIIYANEQFQDLTGYTEAEILGRNCRFLQGKHTAPEQVAEMRHAIDAQEPVTVELRNYRKDGTEFWSRVTIAPVFDETGKLTHFVGFQQDVTDRKAYEEQLERSAHSRRKLHEITADTRLALDEKISRLLALGCDRLGVENGHIVHIDPDQNRHQITYAHGSPFVTAGTVTDLSETFCRKTIQQEGILDIYNAPEQGWGDDPAYHRWNVGCYIGAKIMVQDELYGTVCFVDQHPRETAFTHTERTFVDLLSRWLSHAFERLEHERKHELNAQRLDVAHRVLRHNLRNTLNVISGWTEVLEETASEEAIPAVTNIIDAVDELSRLSDKARLLTEFEEYPSSTPTTIDVSDLVSTVVENFRAEYPAATIDCKLPPNVTLVLPGRKHLETAVRNTLENALMHSETDAPWVGVTVEESEAEVAIRIRDTGPGIPAPEQEVLEEGEETPLHHGSGIGLWLVHWCVRTLDGSVTFEERDDGSCVTLAVPRR